MARERPHPPMGFECPYQHGCPHLDGRSAHHVKMKLEGFERDFPIWRQTLEDCQGELMETRWQLRQLQKDHAILKAKWQTLHRRQFKANRPTDQPPPEPAPNPAPARRKKRGAPKGHPGWFRKPPASIDRRVKVPAPNHCPHCHHPALQPVQESWEHLQEDIVLAIRPHVTCFDHSQAYCPHCNQTVVQAAEGEILNAPIGPVAKATATYLRYSLGMPYRKVQRLFHDLFGLDFVPSSAWGFDQRAAARGEPLYQDLHDKIQAAQVAYADETGWRVDGVNHYLWYAGNTQVAYYQVDRHRSSQVAQDLLGSAFGGVLVCDDYAAYHGVHPQARQACLAHYARQSRNLLEQMDLLVQMGESDTPAARRFTAQSLAVFKEACALGRERNQHPLTPEAIAAAKRGFNQRLDRACRHPLDFAPAETFRKRLLQQRDACFTFLDHPDVDPTNNHAERALRPSVIFRKITFGNRSQAGARVHGILTSLIQTAILQKVAPRPFLQKLILATSTTAQAALFNDSS